MKYYRCPHTMQERRKSAADLRDGYKVRKARCHRQLPSDWEDMPIHNQRSWKSFRRTKYKPH